MGVIHFPEDPRPSHWHQPVLALGNFDGLHRGHLKIIDKVCGRAADRGATSVAMIFDPHPPRIVRPDRAPPLLMTTGQKIRSLVEARIQGVVVVRFTAEMSRWEPETFVRTVLVDWLRVAEVWVGGNFLFGRDRSGNFSLLRALGARVGFRAEKIEAVRYKEFVVSSTRIRRLIRDGRVDEAGALLGHHYAIEGTVLRGDGRGHEIGFPTANLGTENELIPPHGVYATTTLLDDVIHPAITNIGVRPSVTEGSQETIETHVFGLDRDLYGAPLRLAFVRRLRDERTFDTVEALRAQIQADCHQARTLFDLISL